MEGSNQEIGESRLPAPATTAEAALDIIRTETVLSRLPVHNLAKKGSINISIIKKTETGEVELLWKVSPSRDYGEPRQLAYKLDTIVINQRIDEAGRPLPRLLRLGSLGDICNELGVAQQGGKSKNDVKKAFFQNVGALISAKFNYRANDGTERRLEAAFTRYSIIFTGEKLPDGRKADAVYVIFNEPFWEVLNNAPVRPLDRAYMKELPPAAQRFYEIVSRKIFAALKNNYPRAKISYSEYCTFSAQLRHHERQRAQDQMAKVLRPHKKFGYITAVRYEPTIDAENKPDWVLHLTPGPKAIAEFAIAHGKRKGPKAIDANVLQAGDGPRRYRNEPRQQHVDLSPAPPSHDPQLIAEFTRRGITEKKASELLTNLKPGQDVIAQLELGEHMVQVSRSRVPIQNPPGFYIRLIESNMSVPESFETSAKRKAREESERKERERRATEDAHQLLESEYDDYCRAETDRFIAENPMTLEALKDAKRTENRERYQTFSEEMIETIAQNEARREIRKQVALPTFEEFTAGKQRESDFFLKPVAVPPDASIAPAEPRPLDIMMTDDVAISPDHAATAGDGEEGTPQTPHAPTQPGLSEPAVELIADVPHPEADGDHSEPGMV